MAFCLKPCFKVKKYHVRFLRFLASIRLDCLAGTFKSSMNRNILLRFFPTELLLLLFKLVLLATGIESQLLLRPDDGSDDEYVPVSALTVLAVFS
ncbi:Transcription-repair coupling factor [Pseudomonas syringae pv. actinidiae]|uniref:Transcription-repair coupling factor n=1 Tax=Pseudomonas syringae pv. actinidiae TaxID=103796 RepID=A0A2V0QB79_PSESF|nr:Transcription-repair coupling factor [Pseudomonas syringae pv. actinidiae]